MNILVDNSLSSAAGDFGACVCGENLLVPPNVKETLDQLGIRRADEWASYLRWFPRTFCFRMEWTLYEVSEATELLCGLLRGHVGDEFLDPIKPETRGFGAVPGGSDAFARVSTPVTKKDDK